jgi:CRISPR/Cas system endoribonuclease Cas6 (RAMP superfamily)
LPDERHGGVINPNNHKRHSDFVFNLKKHKDIIEFSFSSMVDNDYKVLTEAILENRFKIGDIHISKTFVSIENDDIDISEPIFITGMLSLNQRNSDKRIFKDIRDDDFMDRLALNLFAKTSTFIGSKHSFLPTFEVVKLGRSRVIFYKNIGHLAHDVVLRATLDDKTAKALFHTGLGSSNAKGIGFMQIVR